MILFFRIENYRSIGKEQELNLLPSSDKTHKEIIKSKGDEEILPVIPIYGGNATGKTNILLGLEKLKEVALNEKELKKCYNPCKFIDNKATTFELIFLKDEIKYYYQIKYDNKEIKEEKLYYYPNGRIAKIFDREESNFGFGSDFESTFNKYKDDCSIQKSFLGFISSTLKEKEENTYNVSNFFKDDLLFLNLDYRKNELSKSIKEFSENDPEESKEIRNFIDFFYKHLGVGATGIRISKKDIPDEIRMKILNDLAKKKKLELDDLIEDQDVNKMIQDILGENNLEMVYKVNGEEFMIDLEEESKGIQKIFTMGRYFADALCNDKTVIIDELELSFHPILSKKIVELFMNEQTKGQLIFTTHDTNLLDLKLFRRDQVYFTERTIKTKFQTNIRSLSEIKGIRKTTDIEKGYLKGEYCAAPVDKDFSEKEIFGGMQCQIQK